MLPQPGAFLRHFSTETFLSHSLAIFHIVKSGGYFSDLILNALSAASGKIDHLLPH